MKARTKTQKTLGVGIFLVLAVLYQLGIHFLGWIPAETTQDAAWLGVVTWSIFAVISVGIYNLSMDIIGDLVLFVLGGAIYWVALNIFSIVTELPLIILTVLAAPHFVLAFVAKNIAVN